MPERSSSRGSLIASRSSRAINASTPVTGFDRALRNMTRIGIRNTASTTSTTGSMWTRKSVNVRSARLAMMMLGGSPTSGRGTADVGRQAGGHQERQGMKTSRSHTSSVTGTTKSTVVTLSSSAEAPAVTSTSRPSPGRADHRRVWPRGSPCIRTRRCASAPDHEHHPEQQEDDVPIDPGLGGIEGILRTGHPRPR